MPESVTDRPTKAHEYVFLLTRSPRYFFDADAVREDGPTYTRKAGGYEGRNGVNASRFGGKGGFGDSDVTTTGRNIRSVWEIPTQPYPEAHFATFPEALPERCILAGTSERGCCPECGAPWEREIERGESDYARLQREQGHTWNDMDAAGLERGVIVRTGEGGQTRNANGTVPSLKAAPSTTLGWRPTCHHTTAAPNHSGDPDYMSGASGEGNEPGTGAAELIPCTVLDPFMGSGTTALVARRLGRRSIGIELNPEYAALCARRLQQLSLFAGTA
jgi:hypothetical protein